MFGSGLQDSRKKASKNFLGALRFTFYFTVVAVFFEFWIGPGMAMATFWVGRRLRGILRSIIVIPWAIPPIISAAIVEVAL